MLTQHQGQLPTSAKCCIQLPLVLTVCTWTGH